MKRVLALLLASVLALSLLPAALAEEASYSEAPMLTELVEQGVLPPVEERLPCILRSTTTLPPAT